MRILKELGCFDKQASWQAHLNDSSWEEKYVQ